MTICPSKQYSTCLPWVPYCSCFQQLLESAKSAEIVYDGAETGEGGANPDKFTRSIVNFHYHLQAAHYLQATGAKRFIFIAVEKESVLYKKKQMLFLSATYLRNLQLPARNYVVSM